MSTAIAALRHSVRSLSHVRAISLACLLVVGLSACGNRGQDPSDESTNGQAGAPSLPSQDTSTPGASAPVAAPPPASTPRVEAPPSFTPTADEVRTAMQQVLVQKAMTMPPSQQRDEWYAAESARFAAIKVGKCSTTPLGTPSVCHIAVGDKTTQVKVLLTRAGWILVK